MRLQERSFHWQHLLRHGRPKLDCPTGCGWLNTPALHPTSSGLEIGHCGGFCHNHSHLFKSHCGKLTSSGMELGFDVGPTASLVATWTEAAPEGGPSFTTGVCVPDVTANWF